MPDYGGAVGCQNCYDLCPIVKEMTIPYDGAFGSITCIWFLFKKKQQQKKTLRFVSMCIHDKTTTIKDRLTFISQLDQITRFNGHNGDRHNNTSTSGKS